VRCYVAIVRRIRYYNVVGEGVSKYLSTKYPPYATSATYVVLFQPRPIIATIYDGDKYMQARSHYIIKVIRMSILQSIHCWYGGRAVPAHPVDHVYCEHAVYLQSPTRSMIACRGRNV
jgi:hypothetical protein